MLMAGGRRWPYVAAEEFMPRDGDASHNQSKPLESERHRFLQDMLKQLRKADLPGGERLIEMIEETLAGKPIRDLFDPVDDAREPALPEATPLVPVPDVPDVPDASGAPRRAVA
jgi:hypothetical protein